MGLLDKETANEALNATFESSNCVIGWPTLEPLAASYYHYWPSSCYHYEPNKFEQAFKILQKLIEKKLIKIDTVKQFIETLGDVQSVL